MPQKPVNPAASLVLHRLPRTPPRFLTEAEKRRLLRELRGRSTAMAHRDRVLIELVLGTGIRPGSLVAVNVGDVDLRTGTLRVKLKGGAEGRVFLNPGLRRMMRRFLNKSATRGECGPNTPLFQGQ